MNNYNNMNYYWLPHNLRNSYVYPLMNTNREEKENLYSPKEGFEKGNLFENLYSEYKNYQPTSLNPKTEQAKRLQEIQTISFAEHDLNLYLDTHPEDQSLVALLNDYRRKCMELTKNYEEQYGPLTVNSDAMESGTYSWINAPWPWEGTR